MWRFISKYSKLKYQINVLVLTNASVGLPEIFSQEMIKSLRKESKSANNLIGTKNLFFENFPAVNLNNYPFYKITNIISKYIDDIDPEIVLIPSKNDIHDDHKIIFKAAKVSMRPNKKQFKKILSYEVLSETEWNEDGKFFSPNYFIKLSKSDINKKIKAFLKYKSQIKKFPHPRSKKQLLIYQKLEGVKYLQSMLKLLE